MKKFSLLMVLALAPSLAFARTVSGNVSLSDTGEGEPGVNVVVTGTSTGTITDIDGNYTLEVPDGGSLTFSYLGYESQTLKATSANLNVVLATDTEELEEFVAVGYGTMRKSDVTGSIASVDGDQLKKTPASSVDQALQGKAAGVTVNSSSGQPGAAAEIRIRGIGSVNGSSAPIYVVDGTIVEDISFLSPNDIASTEILKDASSSAIYGSRAANGVILITTKSGSKDGMANISVNAYAGFQNAWKKLDVMQSKEYANAMVKFSGTLREQAALDQSFKGWLQTYRLGTSTYYPTNFDYSSQETDWQEEVFNSYAPIQNYSISIDGADDKFSYAVSGSYFNQQGTIIGSDYERFTIRANTSYKVRKWLKVGENISYANSGGRNATTNNASPGSSILSAALAMAPWDPTHYPAGSVNSSGQDLSGKIAASSNFKNVVNPFTMVEQWFPQNKTERWVGNVYLDITPIEGLTWHSSASMDLYYVRNKTFKNEYEYSSYDKMDDNYISSSMYRQMRWTVDNTITYARVIKDHSFNVMVGQSTEQYDYYYMGGSGSAILNPSESNWYLSKATKNQTETSDDVDRTRMVSFFGRAFYSYANRYMVTVNFRADGTSKFPKNPWGYFPSVSLAWRMSEESWLKKHSDILDMLKLRAGWGELGNQSVPMDGFTKVMFNSGPTFVDYVLGANEQQNVDGATVLTYVNENGKWEKTVTWNVGVDLSMWGGMLSANIDGYIRDTKDMLLSMTTAAHVGNRYYLTGNIGDMRNIGLDIQLDHRNTVGDFTYSIGLNMSFVKNELTSLGGGMPVYDGAGYWICDVGLPVYTYWGYKYLGIFQSDAEVKAYLGENSGYTAGDAKYEDLNHDGKIDENDKQALGNNFPWFTAGLNFSLEWKGIDFQIFFQGVYGNEIYNALRERTESSGTSNVLSTNMRNAWANGAPLEGGDGSVPDPTHSVNFAVSSRFVEDGSYLRLKTLQLGYTLPRELTRKAHFNRVRFYVSANNVFTLTKYSGYDPELSNNGVDYGNYPQARTFTFGVNLDF